MIKYLKKLLFGRFRSLKLSMFYALTVGMIGAVGMYVLCQIASSAYINNYYLSEQKRKEREDNYLSELQNYVDRNELDSEDTENLAKWVSSNRYLYVMIYKDDKLLIDSGTASEKEENVGGVGDKPTHDSGEGMGTGDKEHSPYPDSGITVTFPTKEDLIKYAEEKGTYPIEMSDGVPLLVSVVDYTEYFYFDMTNIASLVVAVVVMTFIIMFYFNSITRRITRLARDVSVVAGGDMNHEIRAEYLSRDEISNLTDNIENMRSSMLENIAKERAAIDSNTELITSMSHDIRTPLTVLLGYIDIMKLNAPSGVMRDYIDASEKTALRLKKMSDDMFNYFLVFGEGVKDIDVQDYDAYTLFAQVLSEHILFLKEQGYDVQVTPDPSIITPKRKILLSTDAPKLMRIAENLFSNISKYADPSYPVSICGSFDGESLKVEFVNKTSQNAENVESNGIGLRTCVKLADAIGIDFKTERTADLFKATMIFPYKEISE